MNEQKALYRRRGVFYVVGIVMRGKSRVKIRKLTNGAIRWVAPSTIITGCN